MQVLESERSEGETKLGESLKLAEVACSLADDDEKEVIEEEVALLQEEFDSYVESLATTKNLLEVIHFNLLI